MIQKRIHVFIDSSNLWQAQKSKGRFLDYQKTVKYIRERYGGTSIKVHYYAAYPANGTRSYSIDGKHKYFTYLKKELDFAVVKKKLKRISVLDVGVETTKEKGNMDVEITIDAVCLAINYDVAVFFSGDSDFLPLVNYLKKLGKVVHIFSSKNNVSQELRTGADGYTDILNIATDIWGRELRRRIVL